RGNSHRRSDPDPRSRAPCSGCRSGLGGSGSWLPIWGGKRPEPTGGGRLFAGLPGGFRLRYTKPRGDLSMTVIVTGGAGFIGSALVRRLNAQGQRVVTVDKLT